jgi:hypothetical protein
LVDNDERNLPSFSIEGFISPSSLPGNGNSPAAIAVIFFSYLFFCARGGDSLTQAETASGSAMPIKATVQR